MSHFSLENDVWLCYNNCTCGISSLVEHLLPKQDRRVRFPYPAPRTAAESASAAVFLRPKCKQPDAFASGCCILYRGALPVAAAIPCGKEPADERHIANEYQKRRQLIQKRHGQPLPEQVQDTDVHIPAVDEEVICQRANRVRSRKLTASAPMPSRKNVPAMPGMSRKCGR